MSKAYKQLNFTKKEEAKLISLIKSHPILYGIRRKTYKDIQLKETIWSKIAVHLDKEVTDCKIKWKHIRDYYQRRRKSGYWRRCGSKMGGTYSNLHFLEGSFADLTKNIRDADVIDDRNHQLGSLEDGFIEIPNGNPEFVDSGICGQIATKFTHEIKSEVLVDEMLLEPEYVDTECLPRPAENSITARSHQQRDRRETDNSLTGKERHEMIRDDYEMLRPSISLGQEDAIDLFFKSMAETVKSFPPKVIAEAKVKVCNLIGELEMRTLSE